MTPITAVFVFFARDVLQFWLGPQFASQSTEVLQDTRHRFFPERIVYSPFYFSAGAGPSGPQSAVRSFLTPDICTLPLGADAPMGINGAALAKLFITILDTTFLFAFAWRMKSFSVRDCISGPLPRALPLAEVCCSWFSLSGLSTAEWLCQSCVSRPVFSAISRNLLVRSAGRRR